MPQPYSLDLRRKVLDAYRETGKLLETARRFNVSHIVDPIVKTKILSI